MNSPVDPHQVSSDQEFIDAEGVAYANAEGVAYANAEGVGYTNPEGVGYTNPEGYTDGAEPSYGQHAAEYGAEHSANMGGASLFESTHVGPTRGDIIKYGGMLCLIATAYVSWVFLLDRF